MRDMDLVSTKKSRYPFGFYREASARAVHFSTARAILSSFWSVKESLDRVKWEESRPKDLFLSREFLE